MFNDGFGLQLGKSPMPSQKISQSGSLAILKNDADSIIYLCHINQLNYVRMIESLVNLILPPYMS